MKRKIIAVVAVGAIMAFVSMSLNAAEQPKRSKKGKGQAAAQVEQSSALKTPEAGKDGWIALFNGKDFEGWRPRPGKPPERNFWVVKDGVLINQKGDGTDLLSDLKAMDQEIHVEFSVPKNGNSGVYLQGRYEVQVGDASRATKPESHMCGAIYGKVAPNVVVPQEIEPAWQSFDIKFYSAKLGPDGKVVAKPRITVWQNGNVEKQKPVLIIEDAEIGGPTGSEVDRKEGTPAGLMLQGDHSAIKYRNILYREIKGEAK